MSRKPRTPVDLTALATRLAAQRSLWEPLIRFDPLSRYYVRLAAERDFEAWLLTWVTGQGTVWHDHGGSAGVFAVLRGTLTEQHARRQPGATPTVAPGSRNLTAGSVRAFGTRHLHKVTNNGLEPAVSLHVYAPSLREMNEYNEREGLLHLAQSQLAGLNW